jgi:hypothetical protein
VAAALQLVFGFFSNCFCCPPEFWVCKTSTKTHSASHAGAEAREQFLRRECTAHAATCLGTVMPACSRQIDLKNTQIASNLHKSIQINLNLKKIRPKSYLDCKKFARKATLIVKNKHCIR